MKYETMLIKIYGIGNSLFIIRIEIFVHKFIEKRIRAISAFCERIIEKPNEI